MVFPLLVTPDCAPGVVRAVKSKSDVIVVDVDVAERAVRPFVAGVDRVAAAEEVISGHRDVVHAPQLGGDPHGIVDIAAGSIREPVDEIVGDGDRPLRVGHPDGVGVHAVGIPDPIKIIAGNDAAADIDRVARQIDELVVGHRDLPRGIYPPGVRGDELAVERVIGHDRPGKAGVDLDSQQYPMGAAKVEFSIVTLLARISTVRPPKLMPFRTAPFCVTTTL